jgi:hypothetical protein
MSVAIAKEPGAAAESVVCRNCLAAGEGRFFAPCGPQHVDDDDLSVRRVSREVVDEVLNVDGRIVSSLTLLITRPGQLTVDYLEGRRARHLPPLRLFLIISAVYFLAEAQPAATQILFAVDPTSMASLRERVVITFKAAYIASVVAQAGVLWLAFRHLSRHLGAHLVAVLHVACVAMPVLLVFGAIGRWTNLEAKLSGVSAILLIAYANLAFVRIYGVTYAKRTGVCAVVTHMLGWAIPLAATLVVIQLSRLF